MTDLSSVPTDELLAMYERSKLPRGLRNNNPGNIEDGAFARGLPGYQGSDGRFAVFDSMESGQAAKGALLQSYGRRGFNTVEKVVGRWAPPSENDTGSYVQFVSQRLGVDPRQPLDLDNPQTLSALQAAIAERENGPQAAPARDVTSMSTDELLALYKGDATAGGPVPDDAPGPAPSAISRPGSTRDNPIVLTTQNRAQIPQGVFFRAADGKVYQNQRGAGYRPDISTPAGKTRVNPADVAALATRPSFGLGLQKGAFTPVDNASRWLQSAVQGSPAESAMAGQGRALRDILPGGLVDFIDNPQAYYDAQKRKGVVPSKVGEFVGNVAGTSWLPGGPFVQAFGGGALLSDGDTPVEVLGDALFSGVVGKGASLGLGVLGTQASRLLSGKAKPDQIMTLARDKVLKDAAAAGATLSRNDVEVQAAELAKRALYKAVDDSGFRFKQGAVNNLVRDFQSEMGKVALSKEAKANAQSIIAYAKTLKNPSLSQLEKLRGDIYEALSKKGGDNAVIGGAFRQRIDGFIDAVDNGLVRQARAYNARFKKADYVNRASQSADLAAERTYGGDYGRKLKDRVAPLVDPLKKQSNFRGATPDETAALNKVARGTPVQKVATEIGAMTDPRRMGGKILAGALGGMTGTAGVMSGGASLPLTMMLQALQVGTGLGATGTASRIARNNLEDLIRLITEGGSRQALAPVPTAASRAAQQTTRVVRPAAVVAAAPALAASREPKKQNRKP